MNQPATGVALNEQQRPPDDATLLVVDVQRGFIRWHNQHVPRTVEALQPLYQRHIATRFVNQPGSPFREYLNWHRFSEGHPETDLAFTPAPGSTVVTKHTNTALTPEVLDVLGTNPDNAGPVHVCGCDTDVCVLLTAADLLQNGYDVKVIAAATASSIGEQRHRVALELLARIIGPERII